MLGVPTWRAWIWRQTTVSRCAAVAALPCYSDRRREGRASRSGAQCTRAGRCFDRFAVDRDRTDACFRTREPALARSMAWSVVAPRRTTLATRSVRRPAPSRCRSPSSGSNLACSHPVGAQEAMQVGCRHPSGTRWGSRPMEVRHSNRSTHRLARSRPDSTRR